MAFQNLPIERTKQHKLYNVLILAQCSFVFSFVVVNCHWRAWQYGMKICCLTNAQSKFVQKMEMYCGVGHEDVEHATRYKTVYGLMDGYKNKNYIMTCPNFFFSPTLFWDLLMVGVHATRTCRTNCKGWLGVLTIDPKKGSRGQLWYHMHALGKLAIVSWFDNKPTSILSITFSLIDLTCVTFATWWHLTSPLQIPTSPTLIHYQEHMRGVDVQDHLRVYYTLQMHDHKWWHRIMFHVIDIAIVNSYIMYKDYYKMCVQFINLHLLDY
jgi:hypothetical protein